MWVSYYIELLYCVGEHRLTETHGLLVSLLRLEYAVDHTTVDHTTVEMDNSFQDGKS